MARRFGPHTLTRLLYSWVMWLAQPFMRARLMRRGVQEPGYLVAMEERLGHYAQANAPSTGYLWIHAVSLGETRAAAILIASLRERFPDIRLLLTHGTATGHAEGKKLLRAGDVQAWQPWDTPVAVRRFLLHFKPSLGILIETEVWPNLSAMCQRMAVPLVLANARLSEKSLLTSLRLAWLARPAYKTLTAVWAQTGADAARLSKLGANVQGVFGNVKFDATPDAAQLAQGQRWRSRQSRPVVLFAISREGEEAMLLDGLNHRLQDAMKSDRVNQPPGAAEAAAAIQWLIVPRHPQRFDEVAALIVSKGFGVSRRSAWRDGPDQVADPARPVIWLGDSLGEMALYYGMADAALLGGSFAKLGGQNLIEAAACGCPIVMGPYTYNFSQAAELAEAAGAAKRVVDMAQGLQVVSEAVQDTETIQIARDNTKRFATAHRGAAGKLTTAIGNLLAKLPAGRPTWV